MLQYKASDDADNDDTRTILFADMRLGRMLVCVCLRAQFVEVKNYSRLSFAMSSHFRNGKNRMEPKKRTKSKRHRNACSSFERVLQGNFSI